MTQEQNQQPAADDRIKIASRIIIYLIEELGDARLRAAQLKRYVQQATELVEKSPQRDHLFEVAAQLIHGIPQALFKLEKALDASAMAAARLDYEEIRQGLRPEKSDELEEVMEDTRLRYLKRRSDDSPMTPKDAAAHLLRLATTVEETGQVPVGSLLNMIASLEAEQRSGAELVQKAAGVFREASKTILEDQAPSRLKLAGLLRRILADTAQPTLAANPIFTQAGSREDVMDGFKKENPDLTDAQLKEIADQWEANKDVVKDKAAADSAQDEDEDDEKGKAFPGAAPPFGKDKKAADEEIPIPRLDRVIGAVGEQAKALDHAWETYKRDPLRYAPQLENVNYAANQLRSHAKVIVRALGLHPMMMTAAENEDKQSRYEEGKSADPTENMSEEEAAEWKANTDKYEDKFKAAAENEDKEARFEEGKPADPTENMSEEDASEWKAMNEEHGDKFKSAADADPKKALARLAVAKKAMAALPESKAQDLVDAARGLYKETHDLFDEAHRTKADYYAPIDPKLVARLAHLHGEVLKGLSVLSRIDSKGVDPTLTKDLSTFGHMRLDPDTIAEATGLAYTINNKALLVLAKARRAEQQVRFYTNWVESYESTGVAPSMEDQWKWLRTASDPWKAMADEHGDKFKKEAADLMSWQAFDLASSKFQSALDSFGYGEDPDSWARGWTNLSKGLMVLASFFEGLLQVAAGLLAKAARSVMGSPQDATIRGYQFLDNAYKTLSDASRLAKSDNIDGSFKKLAETMALLGKLGLESDQLEFTRLVEKAGDIFRKHEGPLSKLAAAVKWDKNKAKQWMLRHINDYVDHMTGEVNNTGLAEGAASEFDIYGPPPDYEIPEELFDLSIDVGEVWERKQKRATDETAEDKEARFEEGKPADPTENMSEEDAAKWKVEHDKNKDKFKAAAATPKPKFKPGDKVEDESGRIWKIERVGDYDEDLGQYRYHARPESGGMRLWINEKGRTLVKEASDAWKAE